MVLAVLILIWICPLQTSHCEPKIMQMQPTITEENGNRTYSCKFYVTVDCLWKKNGVASVIRPYNYVNGNGRNTKDCSIAASTKTPKLSNTECFGQIAVIKKEFDSLGDSMQLNCSSNSLVSCTWKINQSVVNIDNGRYKYVVGHNGSDVSDCTIIITDVTRKDVGLWECSAKKSIETNSEERALASYIIQQKNTLNNGLDLSTINLTLLTPTMETKAENQVNINATEDNHGDSEKNVKGENNLNIYLWLIGAGLLALAVMMGLREFRHHKKKQRKKSFKANKNESKEKQETTSEGEELVISQQVVNGPSSEAPHTYCNTQANVLRAEIKSTDDDGYLVPLHVGKQKQSDIKCEEYEMVKNHVYEKITN